MGPALAADARGGTDRPARAFAHRRAGPAHDGRSPGRGHHRAAQAQVRRRDRDAHPARPVQGDDPRQRPRSTAGTRSRPAATGCSATSGWSWSPTRRAASCSPSGSSAARSRRASSPGVEKGIREAAAEGVFAGLSAVGHQGDPVRRLVPPGRLERDGVQDRRLDGPEGRRPQREARPDGADHGGLDPRPRGVHGRGQPRPQRPARTGARAWTRDGGMQIITAHVPQAELFSYATELRSLTHGRGHVQRGARPLRRRAGPHRRKGHRGPPQGAGGGRRATAATDAHPARPAPRWPRPLLS